jgi:hypothetical protein
MSRSEPFFHAQVFIFVAKQKWQYCTQRCADMAYESVAFHLHSLAVAYLPQYSRKCACVHSGTGPHAQLQVESTDTNPQHIKARADHYLVVQHKETSVQLHSLWPTVSEVR